jgi:hypothetical protein
MTSRISNANHRFFVLGARGGSGFGKERMVFSLQSMSGVFAPFSPREKGRG